MSKVLLNQKISNFKDEGFENVERVINILAAHIDGENYCQFYIKYSISYILNGADVSHLFKNKSSYDWYINNEEEIIMRDSDFKPIEDENGQVKKLPAFEYLWTVIESYQAIPFNLLRGYILENDEDGKWDLNI